MAQCEYLEVEEMSISISGSSARVSATLRL